MIKSFFINAFLNPGFSAGKRRKGYRCVNAGLFATTLAFSTTAQANDETPIVTADAAIIVDMIGVVSGGSNRKLGAVSRSDLTLGLDGTNLSLPWLSGMANVAVFEGYDIGSAVGDAQGVSNIAAPRSVKLLNAWAQLTGSRVSLKFGIIDANVDFDEQNVGALFVHSSHGMGPELSSSGLNGPSILPNTTVGAVFSTFNEKGLKLRIGLFNGQANDPDRPTRTHFDFTKGTFGIAEVDYRWKNGRVALGAWHYTSSLPRIDNPELAGRGSSGVYIVAEPTLYEWENGTEVKGWVRFGLATPRYAPVTHYLGGGLTLGKFWDGFPDDMLGIGIARARLNPRANDALKSETTVELTAQHRLSEWLVLQPDIQYVVNPSGNSDAEDAVILGVRLIIAKSLF